MAKARNKINWQTCTGLVCVKLQSKKKKKITRTVHKKERDLIKYMEQKHPAFHLHPAVLQVCLSENVT